MGRASIPDIQFKRDDREEVRLEKLRRLSEAVQSLARAIDTSVVVTPPTPGTSITMTGPAVLGRLAGTGPQQSLTGAQVNTILPVFSEANKGLVPSPGSATGFRFLRDDGSFSPITVPPGAIQHGSLSGLGNDDHLQYFNAARGDVRYIRHVLRPATFVNPDGITTPINDVYIQIPMDCRIVGVTVLTIGGLGDCLIDIRKTTFASFPPDALDTICGSTPPTLTAVDKYQDVTLTGWTTAVSAGDILAVVLSSTSNFTAIFVNIEVEQT